MTSDPDTAFTKVSDMNTPALFLEEPHSGILCCVLLNSPASRAVFLGPVTTDSILWSEDGRFAVVIARGDGRSAQADAHIGIADFQAMTFRLSWDRFPSPELVRLGDTVLRIRHAASGDRSIPLDVRSLPWARRRPIEWMDWPWVDSVAHPDTPLATVLETLLSRHRDWETNPDYRDSSGSP